VVQLVVPYTSSHSSAEWIVEDPQLDGNLVRLASVNAVNFNKMSAIANGQVAVPTQLSAIPIVLLGIDTRARAVPSAVGDHGDSFTIPTTK
jgi:Peptidase A4 family